MAEDRGLILFAVRRPPSPAVLVLISEPDPTLIRDLLPYASLVGAGFAAGTLNVLAGGGSALTLPLLIFLGLPPTVANGTNRVAILAQNVAAVLGFRRHGLFEGRLLLLAAPPALLGAGLGAWAALTVGDETFQRILSGVMVVIAAWMVWRPLPDDPGDSSRAPTDPSPAKRVGLAAGFFLVGVYGGFVQAGVGFIILAATSAAGLDLVRGNALKVLLVLTFTPLALLLFWLGGAVEWASGLALAAGMVGGGLLGVRLNVLKGHVWVRRIVTVAVVAFALRLWWTS